MTDSRRTYYDHEAAYRRISDQGGTGWDDLSPDPESSSYEAIDAFLNSALCPRAPSVLRALDVGCGGGQVALRLAAQGFDALGVDFSETAIALAKANAARAGVAAGFVVGDCIDLAMFEDASFDFIVDNHLLHCLIGCDRLSFLRSAFRLLRPGGTVFSDTMCYGPRLDMTAFDIDPATRVTRNRTRFWATEEELVSEFTAAGFEVIQRTPREVADEPNVGRMLLSVLRRPGVRS